MKGKIFKSPWGLKTKIDSIEYYVEHSQHWKDIDKSIEHEFHFIYLIMFPKTPDKSNMNWTTIRSRSKEEIINHPEFKQYNLKEEYIRTKVILISKEKDHIK